jgi:hypothetical protein
MRHRRFLSKKHRYRASSMNKYFDNQEEHELHETKRTKLRAKGVEMVNGIEVEFGKKKKKEEQEKDAYGKKKTKKRKRDKMEEEPAAPKVPFKK